MKFVTMSICLLVSATFARRDNSVLRQRTCAEHLSHVTSGIVVAELPPRLAGLWLSTRCEVRPGPEYVLRQYRFYDGGMFDLRLFHYSDSHCRSPTYSLTARGQYRPYQTSWIVDGATEMDYHLWHVAVVPYQTSVVYGLRRRLVVADGDGSCARHVASLPWQAYEKREIYTHIDAYDVDTDDVSSANEEDRPVDVDCVMSLGVAFHELQLMRVEQHLAAVPRRGRPANDTATISSRRLLLGDVHTDPAQRVVYRPMGFQQQALVPHRSSECSQVCEAVEKATEYFPPQLAEQGRGYDDVTAARAGLQLDGSWASRRCESRPYGIQLTRHYQFDDVDATWSSRHKYFTGVSCRQPLYSLDVAGVFSLHDQPSPLLDDTHHIDFNASEVTLTVYDKPTLRQLNAASPSCGGTSWQYALPQVVTNTSGCPVINLVVPDFETDVVRVDERHHWPLLYLGQRPTDDSALDNPSRRPTSYQPALVACYRPPVGGSRRHGHRAAAKRHRSQGDHIADERSTGTTVNHARVYLLVIVLTFVYQLAWQPATSFLSSEEQ